MAAKRALTRPRKTEPELWTNPAEEAAVLRRLVRTLQEDVDRVEAQRNAAEAACYWAAVLDLIGVRTSPMLYAEVYRRWRIAHDEWLASKGALGVGRLKTCYAEAAAAVVAIYGPVEQPAALLAAVD